MKNSISALLLVMLAFTSYAQSDSIEMTQNKSKINELNQRLDNLIKTTGEIPKDSLEIKIDWLIDEMKNVKSDITTLKTTVNSFSEDNNKLLEELKTNVIDANDLVDDRYYVVIGSRRDEAKAIELTKKLSTNYEVQLVTNSKGTWHHVILTPNYSKEEATKKVSDLKSSSTFSDAWWTTSKKLQN